MPSHAHVSVKMTAYLAERTGWKKYATAYMENLRKTPTIAD